MATNQPNGLGAIIKPHDHPPETLTFASPVNGLALPTSLNDPSIPDQRIWEPGETLNQGARPYCFPAGTPVMMADGSERPIERVCAGEKVITHSGQEKMVTSVMARQYNGPLTLIQVRGRKEPLRSTPEHPYLTSVLQVRHRTNTSRKIEATDDDWRSAQSLVPYTGGYHAFHALHMSAGLPAVSKRLGDSVDLAELMPRNAVVEADSDRVAAYMGSRGKTDLPRYVPVTGDFGRLIGLYLAEGWVRGQRRMGAVEIAFGSHEHYLVNEAVHSIETLFGLPTHVALRPNHVLQITVQSTSFGCLMKGVCGNGAANKAMHHSLFGWDTTLADALWTGFRDGDGHTRTRNGTTETNLVTISRQLARDLYRVGERAGHVPTQSFSAGKPSRGVLTRHTRYEVKTYDGTRRQKRLVQGNHVLAPVVSISSEHYDGLVFNLEVEDDHSYVADFAVVHNCVGYAAKHYLTGAPLPRNPSLPPAPTTIYRWCNRHDGEPQPHEGSTVHAVATYFGLRRLVDSNIAFDTDLMQAAIWLGARSDAVCGINWYANFDAPDNEGICRIGNSSVRGGHAIHVCGVNRVRALFILQQSWGDWPSLQQSPQRLGLGLFMITFEDFDRLLREDGEFMAAVEQA